MATKTTKQNKQKNTRAKRWVFTLNNYTPEEENKLKELECEWLIFGHEHTEGDGTPHLQGAITFKDRVYFNKLQKMIPRAHIEMMNGQPSESKTYCTKEDTATYFEKGTQPKDQGKKGGAATKEKWDNALAAAKQGNFEDIPSDLWIKYQRSFKQIYSDARMDPSMKEYTDADLKNHFLWLYGPTGTGKSHTAHRIAEELAPGELPYLKDLNKWWNGYDHQKVTIIEEADPKRCEHLASFFKKWADKWAFTAECKGTVIPACRPEYIIVTSNYPLEECFPEENDYQPLKRRFTVQEISSRNFQVQWPTAPVQSDALDGTMPQG